MALPYPTSPLRLALVTVTVLLQVLVLPQLCQGLAREPQGRKVVGYTNTVGPSVTANSGLQALQLQAAGYSAASFLPRLLSNFVQVIPTACSTGIGSFTSGMCFSHSECANLGGTPTTSCAMGFGTCCILSHTCGQTAKTTCHYFSNPSYPNTDTAVTGGTCALTIQPCQNNICQIRLDFLDVDLQPPGSMGVCSIDNIAITGNGANPAKIPTMCGNLTGQHMYVNVEPMCYPTTINVDINNGNINARKFNIKVTQIPCMSKDLAPSGCLQYHNSTSGTVTSYNYNKETGSLIAGQNYATCIAPKAGYCSITWKPTPESTFELPAKTDCDGSSTDSNECLCCSSAYILIPGATCPGMAFDPMCDIRDPRFCGNEMSARGERTEVVSWHQPFMLFTYFPQPLDPAVTGYSLDYTLNKC